MKGIDGPDTDRQRKLGAFAARVGNDTIYQAAEPGFVVCECPVGGNRICVDIFTPPTTQRMDDTGGGSNGYCCPVAEDEYYKVAGVPTTLFWKPLESEVLKP